jgi:elongator complex protein 4
MLMSVAAPTPNRGPVSADTKAAARIDQKPFCHTYDLTKRLPLSSPTAINFIPVRQTNVGESPFRSAVETLAAQIESSKPDTIHRILIPTLLSPAFYPPHSSTPQNVLQFLHSLRALLRQYSTRLTLMLSLPLTLYPRSTGLVRWIELLSDGVLELVPFPHVLDTGPSLTTSGAATAQEEKPQGMVKVHRLPVFHERGGGGLGADRVGDDLAFTVSRRKFVIKPFSLPPVEGDTEAQRGEVEGKKPTTMDIDF